MKTTLHMFTPDDIVRSVLKGHKVTAQCGYVTTHTRHGVDAVPGLIEQDRVRYCPDCQKAVNARDDEIRLGKSRGWVDLIERVWTNQHDQEMQRSTITFRTSSSYQWPVAS